MERIQRMNLPPQVVAGAVAAVAVFAAWKFRSGRKDKRTKMVLVTGSAQGLGKAIALALISCGDFVVGSDVNEEGLRQLEKEFPTKFLALPMNVSVSSSVADAAARLLKYSGKPCLDAIVNNAGIIRGGPLLELDDTDMQAMLNVNVAGMFYVTKHFFPLLKHEPTASYKPRIVNMGSEVSYAGLSAMFNGPYAMTKFAVEAYSVALRQELSIIEHGAHVVVMNPGAHESRMTAKGGHAIGKTASEKESLYRALIPRLEAKAQYYMDMHVKPASSVGNAVANVVHLIDPPRRVKVNVSMEMEASRMTPQFILDAVTKIVLYI